MGLPLNQDTFIKYVNDKYTANADTENNETEIQCISMGIQVDESNIHAYFKTVTRTITAWCIK